MDFTTLKSELSARGFSHLTDTEQGRYINQGRAELDDVAPWPYREKSVTGTPAPLSISDLGVVEAVRNETLDYSLKHGPWQWLGEVFGDLSVAGTPEWFYVAWPSGTPTVATYPRNTDTIGVQYWKVTVDLVSGSDTPVSPTRYHDIIVDLAERRAALRMGKAGEAQAAQQEADRKVAVMIDALLGGQQSVGPSGFQAMNGGSADG